MKNKKLKKAFLSVLGVWIAAVTLFGIFISLTKPSYNEIIQKENAPYNGESRVENIPLIYRLISSVSLIVNSPEKDSPSEMYSKYIGLVLIDSEYLINKAEIDAIIAELQSRIDGVDARFYAENYVTRRIVTEYYARKWNVSAEESEIDALTSLGYTHEEAEYILIEEAVINRLFFFSPELKRG